MDGRRYYLLLFGQTVCVLECINSRSRQIFKLHFLFFTELKTKITWGDNRKKANSTHNHKQTNTAKQLHVNHIVTDKHDEPNPIYQISGLQVGHTTNSRMQRQTMWEKGVGKQRNQDARMHINMAMKVIAKLMRPQTIIKLAQDKCERAERG